MVTSERRLWGLPTDCALLPKLVWSLRVTCDFSSVRHLGSVLVKLRELSCCPRVWPHCSRMARHCLSGHLGRATTVISCLAGISLKMSLPFLCILLFGHGWDVCWLCCVYSRLYIICCPLLLSTVNTVWYSVSRLVSSTAYGAWALCHVQYLQRPSSEATQTSI